MQLAVESRSDAVIGDLMAFFRSIGLPCDLASLGMSKPRRADIEDLARWSMTAPHLSNAALAVTQGGLEEAIERIERFAATARGLA